HPDVRLRFKVPIEKDRGGKRADEADGKRLLAPDAMRQLAEGDHPKEGANVLHDEVRGAPPLFALVDFLRTEILCPERLFDGCPPVVCAKKSTPPQTAHPRHTQQHAEQGRPAPALLAEEARVRSHCLA